MILCPLDLLDTTPEADETLVRMVAGLDQVTCLLGSEPDRDRVASLGAAGAERLLWAPMAPESPTGLRVDALASCVGPEDLVVAPATRQGTEIAARLALRLGRAISVSAETITSTEGQLEVTAGAFSGTWRLTAELPYASVVTMSTVGADPATGAPRAPEVRRLDVDLVPDPREPVVIGTTAKDAGDGPSLAQASIVVAGGRGTDGDFSLLEQLATLLGGAVGSSRVAVDLGWAGPEQQVGQTGATVAPDLYIAAGISGAVQHLAGMSAAKHVVAINTDPDAPIFRSCDLGIVGDLQTVLAETVTTVRSHARAIPA
ncbi:electron transfer flavoprotein subunit alpha/FixB family protein [Actinotalea sp. M2MS4P-6]|uniref:electron transfer flavoprotein subunit alpha/FixB family protein n=1 Tax=Actinotalea sp. M2MS4P-6 TaxID=2983762 RepID=UPI0021E3B0A7|nr:electron transfer flavoprotein subunit alpha/FixB family protein [Actinotalea sp. M2MS4P-6]MCV2393826.1 electron transfer flavoprotein subunit alpha/FixB family protein [Actinotalea sp. M2MS4P-6]